MDNLYPGGASCEGFLCCGETLDQVIAQDKETLAKLGLTCKQFGDRLETITRKARQQMSDHLNSSDSYWDVIKRGLLVEGLFRVSWESYLGFQACPFGCAMGTPSEGDPLESLSDTNYVITNVATGEWFFCSNLHAHLIRKHHFFEGHTKFRLDPEKCARVLEIKPGVDYTPTYSQKAFWVMSGGICCVPSVKTPHELLVDDSLSDYFMGREIKKLLATGTPVDVGEGRFAAYSGDTLAIVSSEPPDHEIVVDGTPIIRVSTGVYLYERRTYQCVED